MVDNDVIATGGPSPVATPEWNEGFAAMLGYARTRDWVDDEQGAVRGHAERRRSTPVVVAHGDPA